MYVSVDMYIANIFTCQGLTLTFDITLHYGKYALNFTFHSKKISFPKLKEAYFLLAIITNKL